MNFLPPALPARAGAPQILTPRPIVLRATFVAHIRETVTPRSPHRRNAEVRAFLDARGPARGDGLGFGVEPDRIRTVLVEVAEPGTLPAAEGVIGDRHRNRHVYADHADLNLRGEIARGVAVAGEDRDAVAVFVVVAEAQRLVVARRAHHREHGSENLFLINAHVLGDVVEQAAAHIEA